MGRSRKFNIPNSGYLKGGNQITGLLVSQKEGIVQELKYIPSRQHKDRMIFTFTLCTCNFHLLDGSTILLNYDNYRFQLEYGGRCLPKVLCSSHQFSPKCKHLNSDDSLCLYKSQNFKWTNHHSLSKDIIPLIYGWIYFYEKWLETNIWYGFSAKH